MTRRSMVLAASAAALLALAWGVVALRPGDVAEPTLPGWPAAGARAADDDLRVRAWRAWADRDPSVALDRTATLFAEDWPAGRRTVVVIATVDASGQPDRTTTVLVAADRAERVRTRRLDAETPYVTEIVEVDGQRAVVAVAPGMTSAVITTATVGGRHAEEAEMPAVGGVLVPELAGKYVTRVVLKDRIGAVIADRVPGADIRRTPPLPLILRESMRNGRRVHVRTDGEGLTCEVVYPEPAVDAPTLVYCPPLPEGED